MITIQIPRQVDAETMYHVIGLAIGQDLSPTTSKICLDFSLVDFIDAAGVVSLANLIDWLRSHDVIVTHTGSDPQRPAIRYLDDTDFFKTFWGTPLTPYARLRSTTYPFRQLSCADSFQWIDGKVFPWIAERCGVPEYAFGEFKTCVRELFNNIRDHSTREIGCMHVQEYPKVHQMKIAVSDFGVGIPYQVKKIKGNVNDAVAIIEATKEGFTSNPSGRNMGAGLHYLLLNVISRNRGTVSIYSGYGEVHFAPWTNGYVVEKAKLTETHYPGTLVSMTLRTDMITVPDEDEGEEPW